MADAHNDWIVPQWPRPSAVRALITTRPGGVSSGSYRSMNVGDAVGDAAERVTENRRRLARCLPAKPNWLRQVHGVRVVSAEGITANIEADAAVARAIDTVCVVTVADCLPVLLCDRSGEVVAAAHAGWRGLCGGVLENTVQAMGVAGEELIAYLGPAIGPSAFEVGDEVRSAFVECDKQAASAFQPHGDAKWLADLFMLARQRLGNVGVHAVHGGTECTFSNPARYFSHRRDRVSGRMAALIWRSSG